MKALISPEFLNKYAHELVEKRLEEEQRRVVKRLVTYADIKAAAEALAPDASVELADVIQRFLRSKGAI